MIKIIFNIFFLLLLSESIHAQCNVVIPANTFIVSQDTVIDCSFIPGQNFLVCSGITLTMTGNSTCMNDFYMEAASSVIFRDSVPGAPYGLFSFYMKAGATLDFNDDSPVSFGIIDTLVYEPTSQLLDTGSLFTFNYVCQSVVFDYSLLPVSNPCGATFVTGTEKQTLVYIDPVPFSNWMDVRIEGDPGNYSIQLFDLLGNELESFESGSTGLSRLKTKKQWSGAAVVRVNRNGNTVARKMVVRCGTE